MSEKKFVEGQTVILREAYGRREPREVTVSKVGRTLVYVQVSSWREEAFYIKDGSERRSPNAGGFGDHLYTLEEWADREKRDELTKCLLVHNIGPKGYGHFNQSTATLEKIVAILDKEQGAGDE